MIKCRQILEDLQQTFGEKVCKPIRATVRLSEAPMFKQTIFEYAPKSTGAEDYLKFVNSVAGILV
jgi:chromosome partitioning protein